MALADAQLLRSLHRVTLGLALEKRHQPRRLETRIAGELDPSAAGSELEFLDAERLRAAAQSGETEEVAGGLGQRAEAVGELELELGDAKLVLGGCDALVEPQSFGDVGKVVFRQEGGESEFDAAGRIGLEQRLLVEVAAPVGRHRPLEHLEVEGESDLLDLARLFLAEQLARAADFEVLGREGEAGTEFLDRGDRLEPLAGILADGLKLGDEEVGISAMVAAPDAAAELVQLSQPEAIGTVDQDRVGIGHVDP